MVPHSVSNRHNGLWLFLAVTMAAMAGAAGIGMGMRQDASPASAPSATALEPLAASQVTEIAGLVQQLGDEDYNRREEATRRLIALGLPAAGEFRKHLADAADPEIRNRLIFVLENIVPPPNGVLVVRALETSGLQPGDVIVQAGGRRVRSQAELAQRLTTSATGLFLRVLTLNGPHDVGPVSTAELQTMQDYVAPRGETLARALRLYVNGYAEQAHALLSEIHDEISSEEFSAALRAQIAFCAGHSAQAFELIAGMEGMVRTSPEARMITRRTVWTAPSEFDLAGPGKAPFHLELEMMNAGGEALYNNEDDPDLRVQRVLVPAGRYVDAVVRAAELWLTTFRQQLTEGGHRPSRVFAGNQLAVASWMFAELGLRSESCRLIEPRSEILRSSSSGIRKWVRVDTDAWLPLLAGEEADAATGFFDDAMSVLQSPPTAFDQTAIIRNPMIAARLGFFLYKDKNEARRQEAIKAVARPEHPAAEEFVRWMLLATDAQNADAMRGDLAQMLPVLSDTQAAPVAKALALLEYLREKPEAEILQTARQRLFQSLQGPEREAWLALVDSMTHLAGGRANDAARVLAQFPPAERRVAPLRHTAAFFLNPPPEAQNHAAALAARLAVPVGVDTGQWILLGRDRRLLLLDTKKNTLTAITPPGIDWFPNPLAWPWITREEGSGRVWAYSPRRILEITPGVEAPLRLNIADESLEDFDRHVGPRFSILAEAVKTTPKAAGENGEFLRAEVKAHAECVADPDLPEVSVISPLSQDPRVIFVGLRGGPHIVIDTTTERAWTSIWFQKALNLPRPPMFVPQALWPKEAGSEGQAVPPPIVFLISDQGLIRFSPADETPRRLDLPGEQATPALVPESAPYARRDPAFLYFARLPWEGGQVFRLTVADDRIEQVDMTNQSLPAAYYALMPRADVRAMLNVRFNAAKLESIENFVDDAIRTVSGMPKPR